MKYFLLFILGFYSIAKGQENLTKMSYLPIHKTCSIKELYPPEFLTPALENNYHKETTSGDSIIFKLRDDCRFYYEYYYLPYNAALLDLRLGKFLVKDDTIFFSFEQLIKPSDDLMHMNHFTPVPWGLPSAPNYLVMKNGKMYEPSKKKFKREYHSLSERFYYAFKKLKKKPKQKNYYILSSNLEIELYKCD